MFVRIVSCKTQLDNVKGVSWLEHPERMCVSECHVGWTVTSSECQCERTRQRIKANCKIRFKLSTHSSNAKLSSRVAVGYARAHFSPNHIKIIWTETYVYVCFTSWHIALPNFYGAFVCRTSTTNNHPLKSKSMKCDTRHTTHTQCFDSVLASSHRRRALLCFALWLLKCDQNAMISHCWEREQRRWRERK